MPPSRSSGLKAAMQCVAKSCEYIAAQVLCRETSRICTAVQVEAGATADEFIVKVRGSLESIGKAAVVCAMQLLTCCCRLRYAVAHSSAGIQGRGMLHLGILVENMRREGFEFQIGPPKVIMKPGENGKKQEPFDEATVDVPEEHVGACVDMLGSRKGAMQDMTTTNVRSLRVLAMSCMCCGAHLQLAI